VKHTQTYSYIVLLTHNAKDSLWKNVGKSGLFGHTAETDTLCS
jgi:hypothetical protein